MTRAQEAAAKSYKGFVGLRIAFIKGYEQAEKDLALTWEDMLLITTIVEEALRDEWRDKKAFAEWVLQEFNKLKNKNDVL